MPDGTGESEEPEVDPNRGDLGLLRAPWFLTEGERGNRHTSLNAWSSGNLVHSLIDGREYFERVASALDGLRTGDQVYFAAWAGDPHEGLTVDGSEIGKLMCRALDAGASVHGLFWAPMPRGKPDYVKENERFIELLRAHGGSALLDRRVRLFGSHHQKFLVIRRRDAPEEDVAFLGGIDPSPSRRDDGTHRGDSQVQDDIAEAYGDRPPWHDLQLAVSGPAVAEVETCFRERWDDVRQAQPSTWHRDPGALPAQDPPPPVAGPHAVQVLRTYPKKKGPPYRFAPEGEYSIARAYAKALARAQHFIYVEDQFLWSPMVADAFAEALRRVPELRLVAVLPHQPDQDDRVLRAVNDLNQRRAMDLLREAGGSRVDFLELVNGDDVPIFVHSKVCVIDDVWATAGSANLNRRSWTYDSELSAAVVDETPDGSFARGLRVRLWREHLQRADDTDLADVDTGIAALRKAADELERWYASGRVGPRPPGHVRRHPRPRDSAVTGAWAAPVSRLVVDPDGRPRTPRSRNVS
ncbi:phospholipase [Saccharopolyspora rhizosphaerae]|uniref:Phospholipase n=1 Tax=Saccharopolyspora rhizosphaerae TaxID=2492662 RepID=A0A3R8Q8E4_9PSEU|nr:phospholipase [Saccharopolyspora rhizosphaerae]